MYLCASIVSVVQARNYVLEMSEGPRTALNERFPEAGADALNLLSRMLTFDPSRRISVRDAMRHPWLARFYQVGGRWYMYDFLGIDRLVYLANHFR